MSFPLVEGLDVADLGVEDVVDDAVTTCKIKKQNHRGVKTVIKDIDNPIFDSTILFLWVGITKTITSRKVRE